MFLRMIIDQQSFKFNKPLKTVTGHVAISNTSIPLRSGKTIVEQEKKNKIKMN